MMSLKVSQVLMVKFKSSLTFCYSRSQVKFETNPSQVSSLIIASLIY